MTDCRRRPGDVHTGLSVDVSHLDPVELAEAVAAVRRATGDPYDGPHRWAVVEARGLGEAPAR
jgi:hypothetical protein